jgi:hypothetical protein
MKAANYEVDAATSAGLSRQSQDASHIVVTYNLLPPAQCTFSFPLPT